MDLALFALCEFLGLWPLLLSILIIIHVFQEEEALSRVFTAFHKGQRCHLRLIKCPAHSIFVVCFNYTWGRSCSSCQQMRHWLVGCMETADIMFSYCCDNWVFSCHWVPFKVLKLLNFMNLWCIGSEVLSHFMLWGEFWWLAVDKFSTLLTKVKLHGIYSSSQYFTSNLSIVR